MPDFSKRTLLPEKMDQPGVPEHETKQALRELEVINKFLGGYSVVLNALGRLEWKNTLTVLDLGCGGGDMLRMIAAWAEKNGRSVRLIGVDRNPVMIEYAELQSKEKSNISYRQLDVFDNELMNEKADVVINSLFCHHFDNAELAELVRRMHKLASKAIIINDLHRHWFAYYSIKVLTYFFSRTELVKYDGPLSVARSLTRKEWESICSNAGLDDYRLKWMWAWRWQLVSMKNAN
jgi:2-polyprenyl-3-methyl-5-hydroxy-6-metoxy-1,4-benzoquinol methylase